MATKIQVRRDTAANWTSVNPTLSDGELGYETNTGYMKIGNGSTQWSSLSYFTPGAVDGDANTTYTLGTTASGGNANITLTGSDSTNDSVTLVAGTNVTLSVAGDNITAAVDTDLANYNNSNTGFISASSSDTLTNKSGNISQWTNDSNYLTSGTISISGKSINELSDVSTGSASGGDILLYDGSNWTPAFQFNTEMQFLSGLNTRRNIGYSASDWLEFAGHSAGGVIQLRDGAWSTFGAGRYYINRIDGDFIANITDSDVNFNRALEYKIIVNNYYEAPTSNIVIRGLKSDPSFDYPRDYRIVANNVTYTYTASDVGSSNYFTGIAALNIPGLTIGSYTDNTYTNGVQITYTPQTGSDSITLQATGGNASGWSHLQMSEREYTLANDNGQFGSPGVVLTGLQRDGNNQDIIWVGGGAPIGGTDRYDIYDIYSHHGSGSQQPRKWFVRHSTSSSIEDAQLFNGDLTGSVFGDDSTILVDGINNTIPAANLSGALPALDAGNLTNIPAGDIVTDTTPQLGGDLDLNGNDITGTGSIELETNKSLTFKTTVSGNGQDIGSIVASNGTNDFNKVSFKTGPDDYANNGEVNWATRVNGTLTSIFEINGSSLAKSGMVINPDSNAGIDFQIKGNNDGLLVFVDSGLDKVGIGKVPANGILDVDGDVYATNFQGNVTGNVTGNVGNFSLASSVIDTTDSSGITVTPAVTMSSDLTVENNLVVDNAIQSANLTVSGTTTANGVAVFEQGVIEGFSSLASATGTVAHNCANGHIFRHTGISADFTANFTNLGITDDHGTMISLILVQGGTAYIPTAVQIDGAAQTILWQGGSAPSGTANGTDIVSFSITQSAGTRTVLGQLTSYS